MRFTVLVENESDSPRLRAEHGISIWVESDGANILFDTGASSAFAENADRLGVRLERADALVLSHAHADHTGGLRTFLERNASAPVYAGPGIAAPRYSVKDGRRRAIGIDPAILTEYGSRFREVADTVYPAPGMGVSRVPDRPHPAPSANRHLFREYDGRLEPDPFEEELFLWVESSHGIDVVTGCSHSGIANIVDAASTHGTVRSVIGGFHLKGEEEARVRGVGHRLAAVRTVYTGHCTGREAFDILRRELGSRVRYASTGTRGAA
jgi:7,8-dihydropterin-6-yl-methyl-4-(beta-D-ribofuranosyl)aminobenzene 5'-phosphate synthase